MTRFVPFLTFTAVMLVLSLLLLQGNASPPRARPLPALSLKSMDGKTAWRQDVLKGQVTVINVFASWCTPCAEEMPDFVEFKKEYPDVVMYGIAWNDDAKTVDRWLKKNGNPFNIVWLDPDGEAAMALGVKGVPETIVVDANGQVRFQLSGTLTDKIGDEVFDPLIEQLLQEASGVQLVIQ